MVTFDCDYLLGVFKQHGPAEMNEKIGQLAPGIAGITNASLSDYIVGVCKHVGIPGVKELKDRPKCTTLPPPDPNNSSHGHSVASILGLGKSMCLSRLALSTSKALNYVYPY